MNKRRRLWANNLLCIHINDLNNIPKIAELILTNLLGMVEIIELEQKDKINIWHSITILNKIRLNGNKYLPQWIRYENGEFIDWAEFPWDELYQLHTKTTDYNINPDHLTEISKCDNYFDFYFVCPQSNPRTDKENWLRFCYCITILYNSIAKQQIYPMDFFSIRTLSIFISKKSCMRITPSYQVERLLNMFLDKFICGNIDKKGVIQVPNYPVPYIECELREGMDSNLCMLRKVIWTTKIHQGLGYRKLTDEVFLDCIGFLARILRKGENRVLRNDRGFLGQKEMLEVMGNCLTLHFLHFPRKLSQQTN